MNEQYHINLENFSLKKLKISLQKRDMIPSRIILKEKIEENFAVLTANGIKNLKTLSDQLKTKQKIEVFSEKSGLSVNYLTILKREVNSYLPNPIRLKDFPGIDTEIISVLETIGIKNTRHYFDRVKTGDGIEQLSQLTGVSTEKLNELASLSNLARLYGVGPAFARIIYAAGIKSVNCFLKYEAEEFISIYENKTRKKADFGVNDINFSLELAKELEAV